MEQLSVQEAQLNARELVLKSDEKEETTSRKELEEQQTGAEQEAGDLKLRSRKLNLDLNDAQEAFASGNEKLAQAREDYQRQSARFETLRSMTERYEGYGGSIRRVMEQKDHFPGILGVVADLIQTTKKYELAVETALGGSIQNIVTDNEQTAKSMIAFLKENKFGRATFLPLTAMKAQDFSQKSALNEPGVVGLASGLVTCRDMFRQLAGHLLGRTLVVDQIDHAVAIARKYHYSIRIVTLDGELLSPGGSMTGGAFRSSSNLLGRRREIDDLSRALSKKRQALESLEKEVEQAHDRRNRLREEIAAVTGRIQQSSYDLGTLKLKMQDVDLRIQKTQDAFAQINVQREEIAHQRESLKAQHDVSGDSLKQSDASQKALNDDIDSRTKELDAQKRSAAEADTLLSRLQVQLAGSGQERTFITQNQERLREEIHAREMERDGIEETLRNQAASKADKEEKIGSLKEQAQKEQEREAQLKEELQQLTARRDEKEKKQKTFFTEREQLAEHSTYLDREVLRLE